MTSRSSGDPADVFTSGSGNVFADLGLPHPEEELAKAHLADAVADAIAGRGLSQAEAGKLLGIGQPKVSRIVNGSLAGFSQGRLVRFLRLLGRDVEIRVGPVAAGEREGGLTVSARS